MLQVKPFRAMRFNTQKAGTISSLCCPPYDIISEEQRKAYIAANEHNIIRLELPRGETPYETAGATLKEWLAEGVLAQDDKAGIYLYEEEFTVKGETKRVKGFISLVKLEEFEKEIILPHEETLSKAKADRFNLMSSTYCNFSQIYSLYFDENRKVATIIERLSAGRPDVEFTAEDGIVHRLWCVYEQEEINAVAKLMEDKKAYIADGHHRYETALNFRNHLREQGVITDDSHLGNYVMMMLVNMEHEGLVVFPTHRIVKNLASFDEQAVLHACEQYFDIETKQGDMQAPLEEKYNQGKKSFVLYTGKKEWRQLTLKDDKVMTELLPEMSEAYKNLDVSILHTLVLERIFGIDKENMANQVNLRYTRDFDEAIEAVDGGEANCAFIINPTRVSEIAAVAEAKEKMPQKSTYFYPKLITGLVMNKLQ
ncbi:uncharacterized protein (DUF1015 family) [Hydrogenoanaerobacterium saccharovorans]|uniref:Uncharacterized conserved protein, DUF1015 family n=1 Tax=Hydrogenoanaerobacterium saccharovorans TaxID=474960 RepID=A0A1H8CLR0_9FIRM|nr:DUF1015 domain-containing protein [Hydrogenoanaerobacterium saccharovorans]RPF43197.1 uncharacterized protein (DUF1015 family) [Hydrogenoanaerobacterium saccharovorans]SEM95916.1 Uncharacterized conserved protein, DUF1015 family [Hydrogenoanaerobacterium saccharovorans]